MTPDQHKRVTELYLELASLPPKDVPAALSARCPDDEIVRQRVLSMLAVGPTPLHLDPTELAEALDAHSAPPELPRLTINRTIGSGGMGVVYEATQEQTGRRVAVKVIRPELVSPETLRRFDFETRALARLEHPGIARLYESGTVERNGVPTPYFSMAFVDGVPLSAALAGSTARDRVETLISICRAVQHAHQRGVIHRDLKPGNILVDDDLHPTILDFGVARLIDATGPTLLTGRDRIIGTLAYMSPEQLGNDPDAVDTRTDVYALGVIAYELLGGRAPHALTDRSLAEAARVITDGVPAPLSSLDPACRGDLETIVGTAMAKLPDDRYTSPSALADDLQRWINHEPITARRATGYEQLRQFARRNKTLAVTSAAVAASLSIGLGLATWQAMSALDARRAAVQQAALQETITDYLIDELLMRATPFREADPDLPLSAVLASAGDRLGSIEDPIARGTISAALARANRAIDSLDDAERHARSAEGLFLSALGPEHRDTLGARDELGTILHAQGRFADATAKHTDVLAARTRLMGGDHPETASTRIALGFDHAASGAFEEALELYRETFDQLPHNWHDAHPQVAILVGNMAHAYAAAARYDEALPVARDALRRQIEALGEHHPVTLSTMDTLAHCHRATGSPRESERLRRQMLAVASASLGPDHVQTLAAMHAVGVICMDTGRLDEAEQLLTAAHRKRSDTQGPDHPGTLAFLTDLAHLRNKQGNQNEACELLLHAASRYYELQGLSSPRTIDASNHAARALLTLDRAAEAEPITARAMAGAMSLPPDHFLVAVASLTRGECLSALGRADEAEPLLLDAYEAIAERFGEAPPAFMEALVEHYERTDNEREATAWRAKMRG